MQEASYQLHYTQLQKIMDTFNDIAMCRIYPIQDKPQMFIYFGSSHQVLSVSKVSFFSS